MAGLETEFAGEAWAAEGAGVGYLPQEPELDPAKDVAGNVMEGWPRPRRCSTASRRSARSSPRSTPTRWTP